MISIKKITITLFVSLSFIFIYLLSPIHEFVLWDQVTIIRGIELKFNDLFSQAHLLRYILILPIFYFSELLKIDPDLIFEAISFFNLFLIALNCISLSDFYLKKNTAMKCIFFTALLILISSFMNGRIIFALLGYSYLLLSVHRWEYSLIGNIRFTINSLISLFLCSVSTGTFLSCIIFLITWMTIYSSQRSKLSIGFIFSLVFLAISPIIYLYIFKNINFYGGGWNGLINMLQHGAGEVFYLFESDILLLILIEIFVITLVFGFFYYKKKNNRLLMLILLTSIVSGLFGYSTLSLSIIPMSLVLIIFIVRMHHFLISESY